MAFMADMGAMKAQAHRFCIAPMMDWQYYCLYTIYYGAVGAIRTRPIQLEIVLADGK